MVIREHTTKVIDGDTTYVVRICAEERIDQTWGAWIEFHPTDISQPILRTEQERSQPTYPRPNIGPMGLNRSISKAHSPVPRGGCSSGIDSTIRATLSIESN